MLYLICQYKKLACPLFLKSATPSDIVGTFSGNISKYNEDVVLGGAVDMTHGEVIGYRT